MQSTSIDNEFLSSEFDEEITLFPYAQVINEKRKSDCGFFITVDNMSAADWILATDQQYHTATWGNGEETQGLLIQNPRLIILLQSPLLMFERSTGLNLGAYESNYYRRNKSTVVLKTKYLVYFVDEQNQPRHTIPMQLTMKGAAGASFGEHLIQFRLELEKAFALAHKKAVQRKNSRFHVMGVFCIQTEPQLRGDEQKAWVCATSGHEQPTQENWLNYFVGFTDLKERLFTEMEMYSSFGQVKAVEAQSTVTPASLQMQSDNASIDYIGDAEASPISPTKSATQVTVGHGLNDSADNPDIPF